MIRQEIYIEPLRWHVTVFYAVTHYDVEEITARLVQIGCEGENLSRAIENLSAADLNTGLCYSNRGASVLVIGCASSAKQFANSLSHEQHHLASQIASNLGWDLLGESVCYLAGNIAAQMYPIAKNFLCTHCRKTTKKFLQQKNND